MQKLLYLINPHAGRGDAKRNLADTIAQMEQAGFEVTVHVTSAPLDATQYVVANAKHYDRIICAGGDGTLGEVVSGLMQIKRRPVLGYLPTGTTNDFAHSIGIPKAREDALALALSRGTRALDIGSFNEQYFNYIAAFGLFTEISYETPQEIKNVFGHMAYILQGVKSLANIKTYPMQVQTKDALYEGEFLYGMVSNSYSIGGFTKLTPDTVSLDDGLYEVLLIHPVDGPLELQELVSDLLALKKESERYTYFKTPHITMFSEHEVPWTLDGEFGGAHQDVEIINHKCAVTFAVGDTADA